MIDIGRVFSDTFTQLKQRGLQMLAMWAVFIVIQIVFFVVAGGVLGASMGGAMFAFGGMEDPGAMMGVGVGVIVLALLVYLAFFLLTFAQQAAMVLLATPLFKPGFGDALRDGFRASLTLLGVTLLFIVAYIAVTIVSAILGVVLSLVGDGGGIAAVLITVLFVPLAIYLACRFSVLVPVVAVDGVLNPIKALRRSWDITRGKVLGILGVIVLAAIAAIVLLGLPFVLIFGASFSAAQGGDLSGGAIGTTILGVLLFFPLTILLTLASSALTAALHAEVGDSEEQEIEEVFS